MLPKKSLEGPKGLIILICCSALFWQACQESHKPRPKGYPRIEFPEEREFKRIEKDCPYSFKIPDNAVLTRETVSNKDRECWFDLIYPRYKAQVHLTYKPLNGDLQKFVRQSHRLAYEHQVKARDIRPEAIRIDSNDVFGTKYRIEGDVASNLQFFITDSTEHFLRGSLYFHSSPNADSLKPVIEYIDKDLDRMMKSFRWGGS